MQNEQTNDTQEQEFPALSFDETFEIATKIKSMGGVVTSRQLCQALNQKPGGWFAMQLSSLRRWGLVEGRGELRLTSLFKRMVAPQKPNDDVDARLDSFLGIPFFKKLYEKYRDHGLPEDPFFTNTLKDTYGLSGRNPALVARIVRDFITKYVPNFGKANVERTKIPEANDQSLPVQQNEAQEGEFPVKIVSPERTFTWDIKNELDWQVVETALKSIKERWKTKNNNQNP